MPGGWVNVDTARQVGSRYGEPVVLIDADKMWQDNFTFYKSDNKVWLVDNVPVEYIYYF
jgi:putative RNA 2'-phosphotransferase